MRRAGLVTALVTAGAILVAACGTSTPQASTRTTRPTSPTVAFGTWTGVEPKNVGFSGDAGNIVTNIHWTTWSAQGATGHGTWGDDDCDPNCAAGTVTDYPATLILSDPTGGEFTKVTERQGGPHGHTFTFHLPVPYFGAS